MKRLFKQFMLSVLIAVFCFLSFSGNSLLQVNAATKSTTSIRTLEKDKKYKFDLNCDGKVEEIYFQVTANDEDWEATFKLFINGKLHLTKKERGFGYYVQLCDIDTKDNYLDLFVINQMESDCSDYAAFMRYDGNKINEITGLKENIANKNLSLFRYSLGTVKGDGTFTLLVDSPIFSETIGCYNCFLPYQIKNNKITSVKQKTFALHKYSREYKYKAKKSFQAYKSAGSKSVAFTVKKGTQVTFDRIYVTPAGKLYVRAVSSGKSGWISGDIKDLFIERPLWG